MSSTFFTELESVVLYKFGAADFSVTAVPDKNNSIDIKPQVHELTIYESLHSSVIRAEMGIIDMIGLFTNFPLTGEEIIIITYKSIQDGSSIPKRLFMIIEEVAHINVGDDNRSMGYVIKCVSIEAFANSLAKIQQAYEGAIPDIARMIFNEHINMRLENVFPTYKRNSLNIENNETYSSTVVIPNLRPFAAIDMLSKLAVPEVPGRYTHLFYQTLSGYYFNTVQGLIDRPNARRFARNNSYKFMSNEITESGSLMNNEGRIGSYIHVNKRHSTFQKIIQGYYSNNRFEINIGQKAIWSERNYPESTETISPHFLNTSAYMEAVKILETGEEISNRTKYVLTTQREHESGFPVSRMRSRWGKDLITNIALSQIDVVVTIPGTNRFNVGDLFYLEYPEIHGFNEVKDDDLISGYYLITELKHLITVNGYHSVVLSLSKDSYNSSVDRASKYVIASEYV